MAASVAYQTTVEDGDGGASYSIPFAGIASASGQERLVSVAFVCNGLPSGRTISSLSFDGQSGTQLARAAGGDDGNGNGALLEIWRMPGTANTSGSLAISLNGDTFSCIASLWSLLDADALIDTASVITDTPQNLNVDTVTDGVVVAAHYSYIANVSGAAWTGVTERVDDDGPFDIETYSAADAAVVSGETPRTVSVTFDSDDTFAGIAVSIGPAGGGGGLAIPVAYHHYRTMKTARTHRRIIEPTVVGWRRRASGLLVKEAA